MRINGPLPPTPILLCDSTLGAISCVCLSLAVKAAISFWVSPTCYGLSMSCTYINHEKLHLLARVRNIISFLSWMMAISCPYPFCPNPHPPPPHHIRLMAMRGLTRAATIILLSYPTSPTEADHSHIPALPPLP